MGWLCASEQLRLIIETALDGVITINSEELSSAGIHKQKRYSAGRGSMRWGGGNDHPAAISRGHEHGLRRLPRP
jgi:hypothetical protein